ncbi:MAG: TIM barrel protein [Rhodobacteraceae bacterium]|nr:TIM barrel protein [Paracoccaceae bacterium]
MWSGRNEVFRHLGFLWTELSLPDAIAAAADAGFDAVECHWPYDTPADQVSAALRRTGLGMLGLNTRRGDPKAGENGLAALPGRGPEARAAIEEAIGYARDIDAACVHVMAGFAEGEPAREAFCENLGHACRTAAPHGITILIEPLNRYDAPGYFLTTTTQALSIMDEVAADNIRLMFDCYHAQLMEGDLSHRIEALLPRIGHIQFASVPDRGPPDRDEVNYAHIFDLIDRLGYDRPLGAEYNPGWRPKTRSDGCRGSGPNPGLAPKSTARHAPRRTREYVRVAKKALQISSLFREMRALSSMRLKTRRGRRLASSISESRSKDRGRG